MYKKMILIALFVVGALFITANTNSAGVLAACNLDDFSGCGTQEIFVPDATLCTTVGQCVTWIVNVGFILATLFTFLYLLWGGFQYITAGGSSDKVGSAKSTISNAVIGLIIVILAWSVTALTLRIFKADERGLPGAPGSGVQGPQETTNRPPADSGQPPVAF